MSPRTNRILLVLVFSVSFMLLNTLNIPIFIQIFIAFLISTLFIVVFDEIIWHYKEKHNKIDQYFYYNDDDDNDIF